MNINYITDSYGKQSAVVVPIADWEEIMEKLAKMKRKLEILAGLEEAVEEINMAKEGKVKLKSFKEFLDEN
jgi:PHD/YefM family antitoxin component YafN of YafNO toxin-antitoxin module